MPFNMEGIGFDSCRRLPPRIIIAGVHTMSLGSILLIILVLMLIGVLPTWPHSASWGYYPSGGLGVILIVVVVLLLLGRI